MNIFLHFFSIFFVVVKFLNLFTDAETKSDMVATFLAVLELAKTKKILIDGEMNNPTVQMMDEVNDIER